MLTLEHIDPISSDHICGLKNSYNEILADASYNFRKSNCFVPYRICKYSAPQNFGDSCEFLIQDEWKVCKFGDEVWWKEAHRIGCAHNKNYYERTKIHRDALKRIEEQYRNDERVIEGRLKGARTAASSLQKHTARTVKSHSILATCETTKHIFLFESYTDASQKLNLNRKTISVRVNSNSKVPYKNFTFERWNF